MEWAALTASFTVPLAAMYCVYTVAQGKQAAERERRLKAEAEASDRKQHLQKVLDEFDDLRDRVNAIYAGRGL